jgi:hypothetical protein
MNARRMTLAGAAATAVMLAASAGAVDQNRSGTYDSGDRGVVTPQSVEQTPMSEPRMSGGVPAIPRSSNPMDPNESKPFVQQPEGVRPLVRGDNPNLPNPQTPSAANESAPQPTLVEPTNTTGMERNLPVGGTR